MEENWWDKTVGNKPVRYILRCLDCGYIGWATSEQIKQNLKLRRKERQG